MVLAAGAGGDMDPTVQRRGLRPPGQVTGTGHKASAERRLRLPFWVPGLFIPLSP